MINGKTQELDAQKGAKSSAQIFEEIKKDLFDALAKMLEIEVKLATSLKNKSSSPEEFIKKRIMVLYFIYTIFEGPLREEIFMPTEELDRYLSTQITQEMHDEINVWLMELVREKVKC